MAVEHDSIAVVLVRPQESGNIGAAARAMANMGRSRLILVDPRTRINATARAFAVHSGEILDQATIEPDLTAALGPFERVVGTTASRSRTEDEPAIPASDLAAVLRQNAAHQTALVFGGEASGLRTDELALCNPLVSIPCSARQPTLNLAQAVLLVTYELSKAGLGNTRSEPDASAPVLANQEMVEGLFADLVPLLQETGFARDSTVESSLLSLRRLVARAQPSHHEASILRGILRRFRNALGRNWGTNDVI